MTASNSRAARAIVLVCLVVGVLFFAADLCYFQGYTEGIQATTATAVLLCIPLIAGIVNYTVFSEKPKTLHWIAVVFAILMVLCLVLAGDDAGGE